MMFMEMEISKYPWRCLETAEETPILLGGLLQPLKNICFLESSVAPPRKIQFSIFLAVLFWHSRKFETLKAIPDSSSEGEGQITGISIC